MSRRSGFLPAVVFPALGSMMVFFSFEDGAMSQDLLWQTAGTAPDQELGRSVDVLGDVNGDGFNDIIAGGLGFFAVLSGRDGTLLTSRASPDGDPDYGSRVLAIEDANADGISDFVVSAFHDGAGRAAFGVVSGSDGATISVSNAADFGTTLVADMDRFADFDLDGVRDFLVSRKGQYVKLVSAAAPSPVLSTLLAPGAPTATDLWGFAVATIGNTDMLPFPEIAVGDPGEIIVDWDPHYGAISEAGRFFVYTLYPVPQQVKVHAVCCHNDYYTSYPLLGFGIDVEGVRDANGNGINDVLVTSGGFLRVYEGGPGSSFHKEFQPFAALYEGTLFGRAVGDVNGDGVDDVMLHYSAYSPDPEPFSALYSGLSEAPLYEFENGSPGHGSAFAGYVDLDADGLGDVVVGHPEAQDAGGLAVGEVAAFEGQSLFLNSSRKTPDALSLFDVTTAESLPLSAAVLFLVDVDGIPFVLPLVLGASNGAGKWKLTFAAPSVAVGVPFTLQSFGFGPLGNLTASGRETITVQ